MKQVILDTNCLLYAVEKRIDPFENIQSMFDEEVEFIIPSGVVDELNSMTGKRTKQSLFASAMLKIIENKEIKPVSSTGKVDAWILNFAAKKKEIVVCTYDRQLRKNLKTLGVIVISLRGQR